MANRTYFTILSVFGAVLFFGLPNALAGCTTTYSGYSNDWYGATVNHICGNSPSYVAYNLHGSSNMDADLYVYDEYSSKLYASKDSGSEESLILPVHCGYKHVVMVNIYRGNGDWYICSPETQWNEGFYDYTNEIRKYI
jgi:hypothetical protein